jgi:hypothetical protein
MSTDRNSGPGEPGDRRLIGRFAGGGGSADPVGEAPTTSLGAVTEPFPGRAQDGREGRPPAPPTRPRFEFRPPPSAVCTPRPQVLTLSSLLWAGAGAALVLAVVLPLIGVGDLWSDVTTTVNNGFPSEAATTRDRAVAVVTLVLVGSGVLLAVLVGAAAATMRAGRSASRIALVLLLVLMTVHALVMLGVAPTVSTLLLGADVALGLVAAVLMFLPGTTAWLTRPRRK